MTLPTIRPRVDATGTRRIPSDHPGITELFTLLAYGEVAAFYRLTDEARMARPQGLDQHGQHGRRRDGALRGAARRAGRPRRRRRPAMGQYVAALENYHS
jgi:hypothetical protein